MSGRGKGGKGLGKSRKSEDVQSVISDLTDDWGSEDNWSLEEEMRLLGGGGVEAHGHAQDIVISSNSSYESGSSDDKPLVPQGYKRKKKAESVSSDDKPLVPQGYKRKKKAESVSSDDRPIVKKGYKRKKPSPGAAASTAISVSSGNTTITDSITRRKRAGR